MAENYKTNYKRALKARHIQLIALGGIVGSGFFLSTGAVIANVGPSIFFAYIFGGLIVYLTMLCLGELTVAFPVTGSFINYSTEFISPTFACGVGWAYWISWVACIPAECLAAGIIMQYFTGVNAYFWAVGFGLLVSWINFAKVGTFGEIGSWLAIIKVSALIVFSITAVLIFFGVIHGTRPSEIIGTKYLLDQGGILPNGITSVLAAMALMLVNFQGMEIISLAAGELLDPENMLPKAIKSISIKICLTYIIPILCLVVIFPYYKANITNSVFADALNFYGLKWAGIAISLVTLISAVSCASTGFYGIIRALNCLATNGMAPEQLTKLNNNYVPQNAGVVTLLAIWLVLGVSYFFSESTLYIALLLVSGFTGSIVWISICLAQIKFRKKLRLSEISDSVLKYKTPGSPYTGIIAIFLISGCLMFLVFSTDKIYKLSFCIGLSALFVPMILYRFFGSPKNNNLYLIKYLKKQN